MPSYVRVGLYFPSSGPGAPRAYTPHPLPPALCIPICCGAVNTLSNAFVLRCVLRRGRGRDRELHTTSTSTPRSRGAWCVVVSGGGGRWQRIS